MSFFLSLSFLLLRDFKGAGLCAKEVCRAAEPKQNESEHGPWGQGLGLWLQPPTLHSWSKSHENRCSGRVTVRAALQHTEKGISLHFHKLIHCFNPLLLVCHIAPLLCPTVFGVEPDLTREGGSIPVTLTFQEATGRNVMLLPLGSSDDGAHSQNEKINRYVGCHQI